MVLSDCCGQLFRHPVPSGDLNRRECERRSFAGNQELGAVVAEQENAIRILRHWPKGNCTIILHGRAAHEVFSPGWVRTSLCCSSDLTNSRTSASAVSSPMLYCREISFAISGSVHPLPSDSRIRAPTGFSLNIWPCSMSRTVPPSSFLVLRTPAETVRKLWVLSVRSVLGQCATERRREAMVRWKCSQDGRDPMRTARLQRDRRRLRILLSRVIVRLSVLLDCSREGLL